MFKIIICWLFHRNYWEGRTSSAHGLSWTDWECSKCGRKWRDVL
jgi:hypothetical protein